MSFHNFRLETELLLENIGNGTFKNKKGGKEIIFTLDVI